MQDTQTRFFGVKKPTRKRGRPVHITPEIRAYIVYLRRKGHTLRAISALVQVSLTHVHRILKIKS